MGRRGTHGSAGIKSTNNAKAIASRLTSLLLHRLCEGLHSLPCATYLHSLHTTHILSRYAVDTQHVRTSICLHFYHQYRAACVSERSSVHSSLTTRLALHCERASRPWILYELSRDHIHLNRAARHTYTMVRQVQPLRISKPTPTASPEKAAMSRPLSEISSGSMRRNSPSYNETSRVRTCLSRRFC